MNKLCLFNLLVGVTVLALFTVKEDGILLSIAVLNFAVGILNFKEIEK